MWCLSLLSVIVMIILLLCREDCFTTSQAMKEELELIENSDAQFLKLKKKRQDLQMYKKYNRMKDEQLAKEQNAFKR